MIKFDYKGYIAIRKSSINEKFELGIERFRRLFAEDNILEDDSLFVIEYDDDRSRERDAKALATMGFKRDSTDMGPTDFCELYRCVDLEVACVWLDMTKLEHPQEPAVLDYVAVSEAESELDSVY